MKKYRVAFLVMIFPFLLTGCWDYEDIDKRSVVIATGVDKKQDKVQLSTELARLSPKGNGEGKAAISDIYLDVAEGTNFEQARAEFDAKRSYNTFLGATRVVVFGEKYAKEGIGPYLNRVNETYDYRKTILAVVSKDDPYELFQTNIKNDISAGFLIDHIVRSLYTNGNMTYTRVGDMISDIEFKDVGFVMPYGGIENNSLKCLGVAVMKDAKLIDVLYRKKDEALYKGLIYLLGKTPVYTDETLTYGEDKNFIVFRSKLKNRKIDVDIKNNEVFINIDLKFDMELSYQYHKHKIKKEDIEKFGIIKSMDIKKYVMDIITKSQREYECDIFDFARYAKAQQPNEYKNINWIEKYPNAKVNVNASVDVTNENFKDINAIYKTR